MQEGVDRRKLIEEKIAGTEARAVTSLAFIRQAVKDFLVHANGYSDEDIEIDREFEITLDGVKTAVSVDYILKLRGRRFAVIKCSPGALGSRDRHLLSFARVIDSYQIPVAVVTDGVRARILDTVSGKLVSEDLAAMPTRTEADERVALMKPLPYPTERMEREKRILLAFDAIRCTEESGE